MTEPVGTPACRLQQAMVAVTVWQANCNGYHRSPSGRIVTQ